MRMTFEDGHIVIRDNTGRLIWSKHIVDLDQDAPEVYFAGVITEQIYDTGEHKHTLIEISI